ncbi:CGNR zinc finger domain-containing protein [Nonomuraea fuscirosea]|uniref:CGNR zinc finger domain-containing protein n=1 Tax=Nonomuraea fuscirosea TaxID=1291556 RepID=UPI002DDBB9B2|nr:CGNR zinc finger domain-containing protein [Nonomuraea fuscirosea]WSA49393.1 CGNR zinc finger domain-containing protein [Nonomuraea fuscirosea]
MPLPTELVRDFVNTFDVEAQADELSSPADLALWLRERGLTGPRDRASDDDLHTAHALRDALRAALGRGPAQHERPAEQRRAAERQRLAELPPLPLLVTLGPDGGPRLIPADGGVAGGLARIAAAVVAASWDRLKVCAEETCQWAFIDSSKNRSRSWCSMRVCGNRTKTRAYRARKRGSRRLQGSNTDTV